MVYNLIQNFLSNIKTINDINEIDKYFCIMSDHLLDIEITENELKRYDFIQYHEGYYYCKYCGLHSQNKYIKCYPRNSKVATLLNKKTIIRHVRLAIYRDLLETTKNYQAQYQNI